MKYSKRTFINYGLVDKDLELKNIDILNLFQDIVFEYSYKINDGIMHSDHRWFVVGYHVWIEERPKVEETVELSTWSSNMKGFIAAREFEVVKDDKLIIKALCNLTRYNIKEKFLERLTKETYDRYDTDPTISTLNQFQVEKIEIPEVYDYIKEIYIDTYFIDANDHLNNVHFLSIAEQVLNDYLKKLYKYNEFIINYKEQIKLNEKIIGQLKEYDDSYVIVFKNSEDKLKAMIKIIKK